MLTKLITNYRQNFGQLKVHRDEREPGSLVADKSVIYYQEISR